MKVYISGPLQGSTNLDVARAFYDLLASIVVECGHDAYVPHHNTDPQAAASLSAEAVFEADIAALNASDAVIAHVGLPSTGVGAELALSVASHRRILGLKRGGERGSRFAEGLILSNGGDIALIDDDADLRRSVQTWLSRPAGWFGHPTQIPAHQQEVA